MNASMTPGAGGLGPRPHGALRPFKFPRLPSLEAVSTKNLLVEVQARLESGTLGAERDVVALADALADGLAAVADVHDNRFSIRRVHDLFAAFHRNIANPRPPIKGARYVDLGCGGHNPLALLFLFQLLGARHGTGVDLDPVLDGPRAVRAMGNLVATMLQDPKRVVGEFPITRTEIEANLGSVNQELLRAGDHSGLDWSRLAYQNESAYATSLPAGSADVVMSNSLLEHLEDLDRVMVELSRITAPGGFGIHNIDGTDHRRYGDPSVDHLSFLREPGTDFLHGSNRVRPTQFRERFERHGFTVQQFMPMRKVAMTAAQRSTLASPWRDLPDEVLETTTGMMIVRKPGASLGQ